MKKRKQKDSKTFILGFFTIAVARSMVFPLAKRKLSVLDVYLYLLCIEHMYIYI